MSKQRRDGLPLADNGGRDRVDSIKERSMTATSPVAQGGFGAQSHGSRKGLGGDPPNSPVKGPRTPPRADDTTRGQIADMQSEGPGQP
jgi:hypothetical protein